MTTDARPRLPAVEGWFTLDDPPALIGAKCTSCGTFVFPKTSPFCPNPRCANNEFEDVHLSRTGRVWSYTDARYQPPTPYVSVSDPHEPFAIAAVELEAEKLVVLGQVVRGVGVDDLRVGMEMELVVDVLYADDDGEHLVWKWRPAGAAA